MLIQKVEGNYVDLLLLHEKQEVDGVEKVGRNVNKIVIILEKLHRTQPRLIGFFPSWREAERTDLILSMHWRSLTVTKQRL